MQRRRLTCVIEVVLPEPNQMVRGVGIDASNRSRVNVMTFLSQLIENATHLKDVVENDAVGDQTVVLDALAQFLTVIRPVAK